MLRVSVAGSLIGTVRRERFSRQETYSCTRDSERPACLHFAMGVSHFWPGALVALAVLTRWGGNVPPSAIAGWTYTRSARSWIPSAGRCRSCFVYLVMADGATRGSNGCDCICSTGRVLCSIHRDMSARQANHSAAASPSTEVLLNAGRLRLGVAGRKRSATMHDRD
jgi:hypothetical protein